MQFTSQAHWTNTFVVEEITALAWLGVGNRKVNPLHARLQRTQVYQ